MAQITYDDKVFLNQNSQIANMNKVNDSDLNEIKDVVNQNDTNVGDLLNLNTTDKSSVVNAINEVNSKITKLYENFSPNTLTNSNHSAKYTLNEDYHNFDVIAILAGHNTNSLQYYYFNTSYPTNLRCSDFQKLNVFTTAEFNLTSNTQMECVGFNKGDYWDSFVVVQILGIKL